jgi:hypothetical protein
MRQVYLVSGKANKGVSHLWNGVDDAYCKIYTKGGMIKSDAKLQEVPRENICANCIRGLDILKYQGLE